MRTVFHTACLIRAALASGLQARRRPGAGGEGARLRR